MSLVREALERAEREAAARAAREKGLPPKLAGSGQPYRARRPSRAPLLGGLGVLAAALVAVAIWWGRSPGRHFHSPPTPRASATAAAPAATSGQKLPKKGTDLPGRKSAATDEAATSTALPPASMADARRPHETPPRQSGADSAPARPEKPHAAAPEHVLRLLKHDDGKVLRLGGIAWSQVAPLAYLNGRLAGVGEIVDGFVVERIERDRVLVSSDSRQVWIDLHESAN